MVKKIAIIGGSGFIGTNLIKELADNSYRIHIFDIVKPDYIPINCSFTYLDIRDDKANFYALLGFDYLYILAALLGRRCNTEPENGWKTNIFGIHNLLNYLVDQREKPTLIFTSSCMVYDDDHMQRPITESHPLKGKELYDISKIYSEHLIQSCCKVYGFSAIIFRFFTVFGPGPASSNKGHFIPIWIEKAKNKQPLIVFGDGEQTIDLTHVSDVVQALISVLSNKYEPETFEIYNIATGKETKINDIAEWFKQVKPDIMFNYDLKNQFFAKRKVADIQKATQSLHYKPQVDPKEGLIQLLKEKLA